MDRPPLTPADVHDVVFDKAPLGKRGYDEKQVDDYLDRIESTLSGRDTLSADDVRSVIFDASPLIKRGYHEDQVDDFLDAVVATLERRERTVTTPPVARPWPTEQTTPMPFAQPPSLPADDPHPVTVPLRDRTPSDLSEPDDWDAAHAGPDDLLALPLPPPPPGSRGYRPGDVEKLAKLLAAAIEQVDGPSANDLARFKLTRTFFTGQGYHTGVVDVLIRAWLDELRNRES